MINVFVRSRLRYDAPRVNSVSRRKSRSGFSSQAAQRSAKPRETSARLWRPRQACIRNHIDGASRRAAAEVNRARNSGAVVRGALGPAIRPEDEPRACGLPLAAASPATGVLVVVYGQEMGVRGRFPETCRECGTLVQTFAISSVSWASNRHILLDVQCP